jgi:hypothetical protein
MKAPFLIEKKWKNSNRNGLNFWRTIVEKKTVQILCGLADGKILNKNWNWTMKFRNNSSQNAIAAIQNVALHKVTSQSEFKIINQ